MTARLKAALVDRHAQFTGGAKPLTHGADARADVALAVARVWAIRAG